MDYTKKLLEVRDLHKAYSKEGVPTKALNGIDYCVCIACFAILNTNAIDKIKIFDTLNFGCATRTDKAVNL